MQNPLIDRDLHEGEQVNEGSPPVVVQTVERVITPLRPAPSPMSNGLVAPSNVTFPVLRATTFQHAVGHPLAYVRVLMQVSAVHGREGWISFHRS